MIFHILILLIIHIKEPMELWNLINSDWEIVIWKYVIGDKGNVHKIQNVQNDYKLRDLKFFLHMFISSSLSPFRKLLDCHMEISSSTDTQLYPRG